MDFTQFIPERMIPALHWLGKQTWIEYGETDQRHIWGRSKRLVLLEDGQNKPSANLNDVGQPLWLQTPGPLYITQKEFASQSIGFWTQVENIVNNLHHNVVKTFLFLCLGKALAEGPKIFRATTQQCLDLASDEGEMSCDYPFADYHQPYSVFILELPLEYQARLRTMFDVDSVPTHVFCNHEPNRMITISAYFSSDNIITHLTPNRAEYATLEDAIISNRQSHDDKEFSVAEVVQRLAINFGMWMTFIGTHIKGPLDPSEHAKLERIINLKSLRKKRKIGYAKEAMIAEMNQIVFDQVVEFHDEIKEIDARPEHQVGTGRSPKPHRRKAHWRLQAHGPKLSLRKWIPIKSSIVRKAAFLNDQSQLTTTYATKKKK